MANIFQTNFVLLITANISKALKETKVTMTNDPYYLTTKIAQKPDLISAKNLRNLNEY
jgi:hypothetical protein